MNSNPSKFYTGSEERVNVYTHIIGLIMGLGAIFLMFPRVIALYDWGMILGFVLMFIGMFASYGASVLYHGEQDPDKKRKLRFWDHSMIYVSIAGYYSPMLLGVLRFEGMWGWSLFVVIWLVTLIGVALNARAMQATNHLKTTSYVLMGLIIIVALQPLIEVLSAQDKLEVLYWIGAEGFFYITGAFIYAKAKREYIHAVFHIFVLLGALCHLVAMWCLL